MYLLRFIGIILGFVMEIQEASHYLNLYLKTMLFIKYSIVVAN